MKINVNGMYFCKPELYELIRISGGKWADSKERPIVCFVESLEYQGVYWAIPVGNYDHRSISAKNRIQQYLSLPDNDLRSCFYHIGRTTVQSIFFLSDVIPVTEEYIDREYKGYNNQVYIIKNKTLKKN